MIMDRVNSSQYPNSGYQSAYPQYQQSYGSGYSYQGYGQYSSQTAQPTPPGEGQVTPAEWTSNRYSSSSSSQKDGVAQEMQQQKAQLTKQREDYVRKASVLRHELEQLRIQKQELVGNGRSPDRELGNILRQNDKLQEEIQGKMKAIHNVIEMLSSIIKDGQSIADLEASLTKAEAAKQLPQPPQQQPQQQQSQPYHEQTARARQRSETPENREKSVERACYVHYDTGLHWCRSCDEFPETAKDFLLHLQDKKHKEAAKENDLDSTPWHKLPSEPVLPSYDDAPKKRIPIKGLQFFIAAPSWYCKLCDVWIGDLHCASHHLKSQAHYQNYENFVVQNPHWEMEWLKDREKSMARKGNRDSSDSDSAKKKKKRSKDKRHSLDSFNIKDKKKKKKTKRKRKHSTDSSSSSSSSDNTSSDEDEEENEDRSKSIRVAMRNMKQVQSIMEEDLSAKWSVLEKLVDEHKKKEIRDKLESERRDAAPAPPVPDDPLINQWMTVSQPAAKEKRMLEELKDRMRQKQEQERAKQAELEQRRKEKEREREERERQERRRREEKEAAEQEERETKRREQEELERIRERHQVRFRANNYRRRQSGDEEETTRHEKYHRQDSSRHKRDSESRSSHKSRNSRSRSRSLEKSRRSSERSSDRKHDENGSTKTKKPPGPPSYKKLPFIGRMPLFKNKAKAPEEREETKEIKKQGYDQPRRTRFEPGNLPRAFMPNPEVVCFPKLSSIPPLNIPPPPPVVAQPIVAPEPPKISHVAVEKKEETPKAPPPPKIESEPEKAANLSDDEVLYGSGEASVDALGQYYHGYGGMMYQQHDMYQYEEEPIPPPPPPHPHGMPLEPPPLPPDDDLALLGICADDMAAQSF